jgi:transglutaminase-like putative cysteine protease
VTLASASLGSSYLLVALGAIALAHTGELSPVYLAILVAALAGGIALDRRGRPAPIPPSLTNLALVALFAFTLFSIFFLKSPPVEELIQLLVALQAVKLLSPKKRRDWLQLYLLSFFSLVAAAAFTVEISFAAIFVAYLFAAPAALMLLHLERSAEAARARAADEPLAPPFLKLIGRTGALLLLLTFLFFLLIPRLRTSFFAESWAAGSATTGFSDHLALGRVAEIQQNGAIAMRVSLEPGPAAGAPPRLYWRGMALDLFDGRRWVKSRAENLPLARAGQGYWARGRPAARRVIRQSVILEPNGSAALLFLGEPLAVFGTFGNVYADFLGNLRLAHPYPFQITYQVWSDPEATSRIRPGPHALQLPELDPRIGELARSVTAGIGGPYAKARALESFLRSNYRYSLEDLPAGGPEPLGAFLFEARRGNCEYFASALAVMLRTLGIPALVVTGYAGGEWNPYGDYYVIRQSDAHSWVEAHLGERGWVRLDPTPPAPRPRRFMSALGHLADALQLRWQRYVVSFGAPDQQRIFSLLSRPDHWFQASLGRLSLERLRAARLEWRYSLLLFPLLAAGVWIALWCARSGAPGGGPAAERYRRFLTLLRKRGWRKLPGETPDELYARIKNDAGPLAGEFIALYQRARFSGASTSGDLERLDRLLDALAIAPRDRR